MYMNSLLYAYYKRLQRAEKLERPIAYVSLSFPKYLLYAMGIIPVYPQFHAGLQSARNRCENMLRNVESRLELPHDICGELKSTIGTVLFGDTMSFKMPKPDLVVTSSNVCIQAAKGFQYLARSLGIPYYFCDLPCVDEDENIALIVEYAKAQLMEMVQKIERQFNVKIDAATLRNSVKKDFYAFEVWNELLKLFSRLPAPVDAMDMYLFFTMFQVIDPDSDDVVNLMIGLYNDLYRICLENENVNHAEQESRLLWDLHPVYHKKNFFKEIFAKFNATVAMSTYLYPSTYYPDSFELKYGYPLTHEKLLNQLGDPGDKETTDIFFAYIKADTKQPLKYKKNKFLRIVNDFAIDGVIMHMDRTCRAMCLAQYELMNYIQNELKKPVFLFDSDSMDQQYFATSQITTRLEAFMENL
jgi:benzoyl-CoA reductase/2-hydroxyglutaryl-CoA dehydratase subunit BcrC/BadD/HgdB